MSDQAVMHRQSSIGRVLVHIRPAIIPTILHYIGVNMQNDEIFLCRNSVNINRLWQIRWIINLHKGMTIRKTVTKALKMTHKRVAGNPRILLTNLHAIHLFNIFTFKRITIKNIISENVNCFKPTHEK